MFQAMLQMTGKHYLSDAATSGKVYKVIGIWLTKQLMAWFGYSNDIYEIFQLKKPNKINPIQFFGRRMHHSIHKKRARGNSGQG